MLGRTGVKGAFKCVILHISVYFCVQEAQWQAGGGPADGDDGRHAGEGWSG